MIDTLAVTQLLKEKHGLDATYEYPGYVQVSHHGYTFCGGTTNEYWDVDVYKGDLNDGEQVTYFENPEFLCDSDVPAATVAKWTFEQICRFVEPCSICGANRMEHEEDKCLREYNS